jgi:hypothetical protein
MLVQSGAKASTCFIKSASAATQHSFFWGVNLQPKLQRLKKNKKKTLKDDGAAYRSQR